VATSILAWLSLALIIIPLSVDNIWSIPIGYYHLKVQYLGAFFAVLLLWVQLCSSDTRKLFKKRLAQPDWIPWIAFLFTGAMGALHSVYPSRAVFFLFWAGATTGLIPFILFSLRRALGHWTVERALWGYGFLQSLLLITDALICMPTEGKWHLGQVMIYGSGAGRLCRPSAGYQEPGYFCAFMLLLIISARLGLKKDPKPWARKLAGLCLTTGLLACIVSTSRLGWLGVLLFSAFEAQSLFFSKEKRAGLRSFIKKSRAAFVGALALIVIILGLNAPSIYRHVGKGVLSPTHDDSFKYRYWRLGAALQVFQENIWVGSGPGTAGAYFIDKIDDSDPFKKTIQPAERLFMRHDPLSMNLYTELLSEWGVLGLLSFVFFLGLRLWPLPTALRVQIALTLLLVYLSTPTLARFDLWFVLACLTEVGLGTNKNVKKAG